MQYIGHFKNIIQNTYEICKSRIFNYNPNTQAYWNRKLGRMNVFWRNAHYHHILKLLPSNERFSLLDIGCALGDGCDLINKERPLASISGIDFSQAGIGKARKKNPTVNYQVRDILADPLTERYDYITLVQTLEHFDDPFRVVDKCLAHVRQAIIIMVPYKQNPAFAFGEHRFCFDKDTFMGYNCRVVSVTKVPISCCRCIIYQIKPKCEKIITTHSTPCKYDAAAKLNYGREILKVSCSKEYTAVNGMTCLGQK